MTHKIIEQLRRERRASEITQALIADRAGYDRVQINLYETGRRCPNLETVSNWAQVLGYELALVKKS